MNKMKLTLTTLAAFLLIMTCAAATQATVLRAFVSGTGADANTATNCAQSAPCKTFNAAIAVVTPGGELIALDTAGYGPIASINKAITIATIPGVTAFVVVAAGTNGFTINGAASDLIKLRNINFNGSGAAGTTGLRHNSGQLIVENCTFQQLTIGVDCVAKMDLINCDLHGNGTAVNSTGQGTLPDATVAVAQVRINGGNVTFNTVGLQQNNPGFNGNSNPLFNIFVFSVGGGTLNLAGNTTSFTCTGPNSGSPSFANCATQPGTYNLTSGLK
jgi:hypothetical protein